MKVTITSTTAKGFSTYQFILNKRLSLHCLAKSCLNSFHSFLSFIIFTPSLAAVIFVLDPLSCTRLPVRGVSINQIIISSAMLPVCPPASPEACRGSLLPSELERML